MKFAESGVRTFDCADIYTGVEDRIGQFRKEYARKHGGEALAELRIHTKFVPDLSVLPTVDLGYVERIIDRSIARLGVEALDLVQFHWWDFTVERYVEVARMLAYLQSKGKIKEIGVTNFDAKHLLEIIKGEVSIVSNQVQYSVLDRRPEKSLLSLCLQHNIGLLCYGTAAGGFLSESYLNQPELAKDRFANRSLLKYKLMIDEIGGWQLYQAILHSLSFIAQKHRTTIANVAMQFILSRKGVWGIIFGASASRIDEIKTLESITLDESDLKLIDVVAGVMKEIGDVYELERDRESPHGRIMRYDLNNL